MVAAMTTKNFPTAVVLSIVSGKICIQDFGQIHACIEHMAGGPIWTHQLPAWLGENEERLREAFPDLAAYDVSGLNGKTVVEWTAERAEFLAEQREVPVIGGARKSPFDEHLDVLGVVVPESEP